jgi:hypothetical protein
MTPPNVVALPSVLPSVLHFLSSFLPSFTSFCPCFLPSSPPSIVPPPPLHALPSFLPSLPSFTPSLPPSFAPFTPSSLLSFLPSCLPSSGDHRPNCRSEHFSKPKQKKNKQPLQKGGDGATVTKTAVAGVETAGGDTSMVKVARGQYFADGPPRLTWRQAQLYGLTPYSSAKEETEDRAAAEGWRWNGIGTEL